MCKTIAGQSAHMEIDIRHLTPGDSDWIVQQHAQSYAVSDGFDASFARTVAQILSDFEAEHDPACERGFVAWQGAQRLGCIFCVKQDDQTAKLRLFLLVPEARGKGLGKFLLQTCMGWARGQGYDRMELWTHESHKAACALYDRAGWRCRGSRPVTSFGVALVEQIWEVDLHAADVW